MAFAKRPTLGLVSAALLLACVLAANYVTSRYGLIPVGFGLMATAGTYLAGLTFILRDLVQDTIGRVATVALIVLGAALSAVLADGRIALASGVAFLVSEMADLAVYTPLRERGYVRAAVASNVVGSVVDTVLFLTVAGFGLAAGVVAGQIVGKVTVTAVAVALVVAARAPGRRATRAAA